MSTLLPLSSVALALLTIALLFRASRGGTPRMSRGLAHLATYQQHGRAAADVPTEPEASRTRGVDTLESIGGRVLPRFGSLRTEALQTRLRGAGLYSVTPEAFLGAQAALTGGGVLLCLWLAVSGSLALPLALLFAVITALLTYAVPVVLVSRRARLRTASIDRQMPELVVAIEAGLGLAAALDRAATRMTGPLAAELRLVLHEQGLGATSAEALEHLVARSDTPAVRTFVRTLVQGDRLGVPIGQTMRAIALDMRKRRRAAAEAQAQRAPIKILFPLVFCIFPSLLIVILTPALITIIEGLSNA